MKKPQSTMHVKIYAPFTIYFDDEAVSLSAANATGSFDVLGRHKNFMSLLQPGVITVRRPDKSDYQLKISRGILHVSKDKTTVFLDV